MTILYILIAILIFGVLIAVHELGHFLAARLCGVTVHEFAIGMGPALWQKEGRTGTKYAFRALPIGGYCAMEGEEEASDDPGSLSQQGFFKKLLIFAAGAGMNFLVGFLIILCLYAGAEGFRTTEITGLQDGFLYGGESGLQVGDFLYEIDGHRIYLYSDVTTYLSRGSGEGFDLVVIRDGEKVDLGFVPMKAQTFIQEDGSEFYSFGLTFAGVEEATLLTTLRVSWYNAVDFVRLIWMGLGDLVTGAMGLQELSGPVGIVSTITQVGSDPELSPTLGDALWNIAYFGALIAVNLAVMNLLPLPALDGGRIFFLVLNLVLYALTRRKISAKYEGYVHLAGLALFMGLMLLVTFKDVWTLVA